MRAWSDSVYKVCVKMAYCYRWKVHDFMTWYEHQIWITTYCWNTLFYMFWKQCSCECLYSTLHTLYFNVAKIHFILKLFYFKITFFHFNKNYYKYLTASSSRFPSADFLLNYIKALSAGPDHSLKEASVIESRLEDSPSFRSTLSGILSLGVFPFPSKSLNVHLLACWMESDLA